MENKFTPPTELFRQERTLYTLHTRPYKGKGSGQGATCNEFYAGVQPDYGGGKTNEEAEALAAEIQRRYNSHTDMYEALKHVSAWQDLPEHIAEMVNAALSKAELKQ